MICVIYNHVSSLSGLPSPPLLNWFESGLSGRGWNGGATPEDDDNDAK